MLANRQMISYNECKTLSTGQAHNGRYTNQRLM